MHHVKMHFFQHFLLSEKKLLHAFLCLISVLNYLLEYVKKIPINIPYAPMSSMFAKLHTINAFECLMMSSKDFYFSTYLTFIHFLHIISDILNITPPTSTHARVYLSAIQFPLLTFPPLLILILTFDVKMWPFNQKSISLLPSSTKPLKRQTRSDEKLKLGKVEKLNIKIFKTYVYTWTSWR